MLGGAIELAIDLTVTHRRAPFFPTTLAGHPVIARLDPKSGLPDFVTKLSKSETSDFDAIQYPRSVVARSPGQTGR
jgi:hypothetical protein